MAAKFALIFVAAFVALQVFSEEISATVVRRDVAAGTAPQKNDLEDALNSIKQGFEEFVNKVQNSEVYQNATKLLDEFGQKVKQEGDQLVQKIKATNAKQ